LQLSIRKLFYGLWAQVIPFFINFLEEHIIDYVLLDAIDEALEEATLEALIIHFFPQEAVFEKSLKVFLEIPFIFFFFINREFFFRNLLKSTFRSSAL
jgi:hypothetical protein